jgi:hypothetical protein
MTEEPAESRGEDSEPADDSSQMRAGEYEFTYQDDGTVTARHLGTGIVASGTSYAEALLDLTDTLRAAEHDAEPIEDPEAFLGDLDLPRPEDAGPEDTSS